MKIVIIEGPDNCGKNTIINRLLEENEISEVIHCSKPEGETDEEKFQFQEMSFVRLARRASDRLHEDNIANLDEFLRKLRPSKYCDCLLDVIIFNRAWYGEYVYGQMYRNGDPKKILELIDRCERYFEEEEEYNNVYYIQLMSTSTKLLKGNDDGKSLSDADENKIKRECDLFMEVFNHSKLNKRVIYINKGDNFRSREEIADEAMEFINS